MADVELFWDPVCPFAWITSRWVVEVAGQRALEVSWRPISLRLLNDGRYDDPDLAAKEPGHAVGLALLRVAAAVEEGHGNAAVGELYTAVGQAIHVHPDPDGFVTVGAATLAERALADCGLPAELDRAVDDEGRDNLIGQSTDLAVRRTGGDVGTPIITFGPPDGPSFFGPVISRVPRGPEALALWEAVETLGRHPGFSELKRSLREKPQVAS
ncbi:MAG TPA: hypothetical protein VGP53_02860 [Acidimicrobiales bacterium]|nr:hypothetical protein [Acidimicrobiales bacterium]